MIDFFRPIERRSSESGVANPAPWLVDLFGGGATKSGMRVNPDTALEWVFDAVQIRAQTLSTLPFKLFRRTSNGKVEPATDHPLYRIAHRRPHPQLTSAECRGILSAHFDLRGNAYAQIVRDGAGRVVRLVPLHPDRVTPKRKKEINSEGIRPVVYEVTNEGLGGTAELPESQMLHLRGFMLDGLCGMSPIRIKAETIGLAVAVNEHAARIFSNGARPAGVIEHPLKLGDDGRKNLRASWQEIHGGVSNTGKVAILEEGMKFHTVGLNNEDAQLLQSRKYSKVDVMTGIYRVPPHMYGEMDRATFSNIEQQSIEFVKFCMGPPIEVWEQKWDVTLLTEEEQEEYFFKFNVAGLLRGDLKSRYEAHRMALGRAGEPGWITVNDIREIEDMNSIDGGDTLFSGIAPTAEPKDAKPAPASSRALLPLLADALGRACRKEAKAVRAILRKPVAERAAELDSFYADHRRHVIETVAPVFAAARGLGATLAGTEAELADKLIAESRATSFANDEHEKIFTGWETTRATTVAESLIV